MGAPALMLASSAISAFGQLQAGKYAAAAAKAEEQQALEQKRMAELKAIEDATARKKEAYASGATNRALIAAKTGVVPSESASFLALKDADEETAAADVGAIRLMGASESRKYQLSAYSSRMEGKAARTKAMFGAAGTMLGGYADYSSSTKPG